MTDHPKQIESVDLRHPDIRNDQRDTRMIIE